MAKAHAVAEQIARTPTPGPVVRSLEIEGFRGIRVGKVEGLSPLSVLVGPNNCGKSTVLEAIAALGLGFKVTEIFNLLLRRGGPTLHALRKVFHGRPYATLSCTRSAGASTRVHLEVEETYPAEFRELIRDARLESPLLCAMARAPIEKDVVRQGAIAFYNHTGKSSLNQSLGDTLDRAFPSRFVDVEAVRATGTLEDACSKIEQANRLTDVVQALRGSMPGLTDLRILKVGDDFILHTFMKDRPPIPAFLAGDGFKRFLNIAAAVCDIDDGVVLLEEPESFQHPRYLRELAALLRTATSRGTQIILSTHSIELIDLLLGDENADDKGYPTVHRLRLVEGELRSVAVSAKDARTLRHELMEDLRA